MNSTYSLAYSRAGLGDDLFVARRDRVIALAVALGVFGAAIGINSLMDRAVYRPQPKEAPRVVDISTVQPLDDAVVASDDSGGQASTSAAPVQRRDFVPASIPSPFVQHFVPPAIQIPTPNQRIIAVSPGIPGVDGPGIGPARVFEPGELDRTPVPTFQARPEYPQSLRIMDLSGQAVVDFIVDRHGNVRDAYAVNSTETEFGAAAVKGVSKWKFKPGMKGGRAVDVHMRVPILFSVDSR